MPINESEIKWDAAPAIDLKAVKWDAPKPKNKDYEAGQNAPGALQGLASVINGPLMGFGDEVLGAIGGAIDTIKQPKQSLSDLVLGNRPKTFSDNYRANRDTVRGMQDAQREQNPWTTGLTQTMASAPMMLLNPAGALGMAPAVAQKTGVVANSMRAAGMGAGYGAVGGAGNSTANTVGGVATDSAIGAATGAALGGISTPIIAGMGAAGGNVMNRLSETSAAATAREKIAQALARDARGQVFTSGQSNPLAQILARQNKLGPESALVDAGGKNTNQLLDTIATLPGRTKDAVTQVQRQRTATAGERLRGAADQALGTNGARLTTTLESLDAQRSAAAKPLYDQLRTMSVNADDDLVSIVQAANQLGALGEAKTMATALREPFTLDPAQAGSWGMRDLDHVKRGLDTLIDRNTNPNGKLTAVGRAMDQLKQQLVSKLDDLAVDPNTGTSVYKAARDAYAGPSQLMDAAQRGRQSITQDEAAISGVVRGMSASELEAFRIGAFEGLRGKLGTQSGQTNILNMWKEPATREKLQVIFGDERAFREFASAAARESAMKRIQSVGTGSQTASRMAGMGDMDIGAIGDLGGAVTSAQTGNVMGALGAARNAWNRVKTPETVRNEMGRMLLSQGPEAQQNLNSLAGLLRQINEQNARRADGTAFIGSQIGNRLAQPIPYGN